MLVASTIETCVATIQGSSIINGALWRAHYGDRNIVICKGRLQKVSKDSETNRDTVCEQRICLSWS